MNNYYINKLYYTFFIIIWQIMLTKCSDILTIPVDRVQKLSQQDADYPNKYDEYYQQSKYAIFASLNQNNSTQMPYSLIQENKIYKNKLENYFNVQYYGTLYFGSQQTGLTLIFDTASSWLWVPTINCTECHQSPRYDALNSTQYIQLSDQIKSVTYGTGIIHGMSVQDQICLEQLDQTIPKFDLLHIDPCLYDYQFFTAINETNLLNLQASGVLGLAPSNQNSEQKLFIQELYNRGIVQQRIFSFLLRNYSQQSYFLFGGIDYSIVDPEYQSKPIVWNQVLSQNYWTINLQESYFGQYEIPISTNLAIIDTGTAYIIVPEQEFEFIIDQFSNMICGMDKNYNLYTCLCTINSWKNFPDFIIQLGANIFTIKKEQYIQKVEGKCFLQIMKMEFPEGSGFWILGDNFLRNYYTIFDFENSRIGFVGDVKISQIPTNIMDYLTYIVGGILTISLIYMAYQICYAKSNDDDDISIKKEPPKNTLQGSFIQNQLQNSRSSKQ